MCMQLRNFLLFFKLQHFVNLVTTIPHMEWSHASSVQITHTSWTGEPNLVYPVKKGTHFLPVCSTLYLQQCSNTQVNFIKPLMNNTLFIVALTFPGLDSSVPTPSVIVEGPKTIMIIGLVAAAVIACGLHINY